MTISFLLVKVTLILSLALLLDAGLRRRAVLACAAMWNAVLVGLVLLPATTLLPPLQLPMLRAGAAPDLQTSTSSVLEPPPVEAPRLSAARAIPSPEPAAGARIVTQLVAPESPLEPSPAEPRPRSGFTSNWPIAIGILYATGVGLSLLRLVMGLAAIRTMIAKSSPIASDKWQAAFLRWKNRLGCGRVQLRQSAQVEVPIMAGLLRPAILLPERMVAQLSPESREAVIVHELAHALRGDFGWHLLLRVLQAVLWFHPLIWLTERRIHFIRERACDEFSVHALGSSEQYAHTLLTIAGQIDRRPNLGLGLAVVRTPHIATRIEALAGSRGIAGCQLSALGRLLILLGCLTLLAFIGRLEIVNAQQPPAPAKQEKLSPTNKATAPPKQAKQEPLPAAASSVVNPAADLKNKPNPIDNAQHTISGEVTLANNGSAVVGATIFLRDGGLHRATTDEQGRFQFTDKPLNNYEIWAVKDALVAELQRIMAEQPAAEGVRKFAPVRLRMSPGKEIHVRVTAKATGQPVENAQVALEYPYRQRQATDNDGNAVLKALLAQPHRMTIEAAGHARVLREIDLRSAALVTTHNASLVPGGTVHGVVTDESGQPLAKASVVYRLPDSPVGFYGDSPYADTAGAYRNLYLPLNTPIQLMISLRDYVSHRQELTLTQQQRDLTLNIQLQRQPQAGSVSGSVTDNDGQPIAGASVTNYGTSPSEARETRTDAAGTFTIDDVVRGPAGYELIFRAAGYATARQDFKPAAAQPLAIKLQQGHFVRARVENAAGQPIAGAYVDVNGGSYPGQAGESLRTDKDGIFTSNSLPAVCSVRIYAPGYSSIDAKQLDLDQEKTLTVTLEPAGTLRGQVLDEAGSPLTQFRVRLDRPADLRAGEVSGSFRSELGNPGVSFQSSDGTFTIQEVTSRMFFRMIIDAEGYDAATVPRVVALPENESPLTRITLAKRRPIDFASLSGTVVDHNGNPVSGVQLRLIVSNSPSNGDNDNRFNWALIDSGQLGQKDYVEQYLSAVTDDGGKFELEELHPGKFLQLAYWGKRAPKGRTLALAKTKPGATQSITVQLPEPATLRGSFDAEAFPHASRMSLTLQDQSFHHYEHLLAKNQSTFEFQDLPPGRYWLSVVGQPERHADNPQMFSLRPLASRRLTVEPGKLLEVRLTKEDQSQGAKR
jgi:beta-lactamase regulating signal transducer with metallopeptidase domain